MIYYIIGKVIITIIIIVLGLIGLWLLAWGFANIIDWIPEKVKIILGMMFLLLFLSLMFMSIYVQI